MFHPLRALEGVRGLLEIVPRKGPVLIMQLKFLNAPK